MKDENTILNNKAVDDNELENVAGGTGSQNTIRQRCPHCQKIVVVSARAASSVRCPACLKSFSISIANAPGQNT